MAQVSLDRPGGIPEEKGQHLEQSEPATQMPGTLAGVDLLVTGVDRGWV